MHVLDTMLLQWPACAQSFRDTDVVSTLTALRHQAHTQDEPRSDLSAEMTTTSDMDEDESRRWASYQGLMSNLVS